MKDRLKKKLDRLKNKSGAKPDLLPFPAKETVKAAQTDAEINQILIDMMANMERIFIEIKNGAPHRFEQFKDVVFQDMTGEEIEGFYARVALREAFLAGKAPEPPAFAFSERKVYEMPDAYKRQLEQLTEMIEQRDEYARIMPTLPPDARHEMMPLFQRLSDGVEKVEQKLAEEYERFQAEQESEERSLSKILVQSWMRTARQFLFIKKYQPDSLLNFKEFWMEEEDWIDIARWIDRLEREGYDPPAVLTE